MPLCSRRTATRIGTVLALSVLVPACSFPGSGPDPQDALDQLATALTRDRVADIRFAGDAAAARKSYAEVTDGAGDARVRAGDVSTDGDRATGMLEWERRVGARTWTYQTRARMTRVRSDGADAWRVRWTPNLVEPSLEQGEVLATSTIKAARGRILAGDDKPIVRPRPVLRVGVDKTGLGQAAAVAAARQVSRLTDVDPKGLVKQVRASGPKAFVQAIVYRRDQAPAQVLARVGDLRGGSVISDHLPLAPTREFAAPLLGTVGPATAEIVEQSDGRVRAGDEVGLSGLQKRYDEQLAGRRGETVVAVDEEGNRRTLFTADPTDGKDLRTTLDIATQRLAERALSDVTSPSALVAVRPSTGDLVAAASGPGSKGYNTATYGRYAPGSTFKVVSTLALLRNGLTPDSAVACPSTLVVDGKRFKNYDDYPASGLGRITFTDALANSCNTAFIGERAKLGKDDLAEAAAALGLGVDHDLGFPAYFGQVGAPETETQQAASMIGQGAVLASPMAMATVVASVMQGDAVLPRLLPDHEVDRQQPKTPLTRAEAAKLRSMMRAVVQRGSGTLLQGLGGGPVLAKTGTAEFGDQPPLPTHAWMVAGHDDLAVAVFVERGDSGSGTAGPVLREFLEGAR